MTDSPARIGRVRMIEVAESLGLSRATVSLVMRNSPLVAQSTREAVLREADRLGYVYDRGAASLRSRRSDVVGLVMPNVVNPFVSEVSVGAQEVLAEHGLFVVIANTEERHDAQRHVIKTLAEQRVAGVITIPVLTRTGGDDVTELTSASIPIVLLTRDVPGSGLTFVGSDDRAIGRIGARHLLEHDCRSVAYFSGHPDAGPRITREKSFRRAIGSRVTLSPDWEEPFDADEQQAYLRAKELLAIGKPPPAGILCHSDAVAYGLLRALYEHGIGPQECRVVGIDDLRSSANRIPSLSTVAVGPHELGILAAKRLVHLMGGPPATGRAPKPRLVPRESCGCVDQPG